MFARIMAVVMAAILITAVALSGIWWITLRNQQIEAGLPDFRGGGYRIPGFGADGSLAGIIVSFRPHYLV